MLILNQKESYVSEIIDGLKDSKMIVVEGTVYPLLTRLKNANLLQYKWEESNAGPPRKYYSLTTEGQAFLEELKETWQNLKEAVAAITSKSKNQL